MRAPRKYLSVMTFRCHTWMRKELKRIAYEQDKTMADVIRQAVKEYIEAHAKRNMGKGEDA